MDVPKGQRPKFVRAEHSATAEGVNCAYGPTLVLTLKNQTLKTYRWVADILRINFSCGNLANFTTLFTLSK